MGMVEMKLILLSLETFIFKFPTVLLKEYLLGTQEYQIS